MCYPHPKDNLLMHQYANYGRGNTIHSPCQIEWIQNESHDKSHHIGSKQVINFLDGYATPLECRSDLIYMSFLAKPSDLDLEKYPHALITSPYEWDSSVLDYTYPNTQGYPSGAPDPFARDQDDLKIDECGIFQNVVVQTLSILSAEHITSVHQHVQKPTTIDYNKLKHYSGWVYAETIKNTFENSTQWAVIPTGFPVRKHFKSWFPAFNIPRRNEAVGPEMIFSDTPTIDSGVTITQIFIAKTL